MQVSAAVEQLMQCSMLQLRHWAKLVERVWSALHCWQMLLNSQMEHWSMAQATQVPVLLTENPSLQVPQELTELQMEHSATEQRTQMLPSGEGL